MGGVAWTEEEDRLLRECIQRYGEGKWHRIPLLAGLNRCRKSCRLRWFNYLRPNIKRGSFTNDEVENIIKLHKVYGNRWSLIASKLPGRTANDVKNYWNCHLSKRLNNPNYTEQNEEIITHNVVHDNNNQCGSYEYKQRRPEIIKINNISGHNYPMNEPGANTQASKDTSTLTLSKDIVTYVRGELYEDETSPKQDYVKYPCGGEEDGIMEVELGKDEIDFGLEEIQITMGEQSKCKWDFDELTFDLELWTNSL